MGTWNASKRVYGFTRWVDGVYLRIVPCKAVFTVPGVYLGVFTSGVYLRVPNLCLCCGTRASMESVFATVFPMHFPGASVYHQIGDSTWNLEYEVQMAIVDRLPVLAKRARGFADCLSNCTGCLMRWTLAHLFARETPRALVVRRQ